jgi:uncharacterized protein (DUF433 family)
VVNCRAGPAPPDAYDKPPPQGLSNWDYSPGLGVSRHSGVWDPRAYSDAVAYELITIDLNRMSGLPCIRDTRVTVSAVLGQLAAGLTIPELLADFPYLDRADVLAALEYAAAAVQERELPLAQAA